MTNDNRTENEKPTRREFLARSAGLTAGLVGGLELAKRRRRFNAYQKHDGVLFSAES